MPVLCFEFPILAVRCILNLATFQMRIPSLPRTKNPNYANCRTRSDESNCIMIIIINNFIHLSYKQTFICMERYSWKGGGGVQQNEFLQ